jgi:hypothetical protein
MMTTNTNILSKGKWVLHTVLVVLFTSGCATKSAEYQAAWDETDRRFAIINQGTVTLPRPNTRSMATQIITPGAGYQVQRLGNSITVIQTSK